MIISWKAQEIRHSGKSDREGKVEGITKFLMKSWHIFDMFLICGGFIGVCVSELIKLYTLNTIYYVLVVLQ